jgi:hypothetical protein
MLFTTIAAAPYRDGWRVACAQVAKKPNRGSLTMRSALVFSPNWATANADASASNLLPKSATSDGDKAKGPALPVADFGATPWQ